MVVSVHETALGALVMMGFALAVSRRWLMLSASFCFVALVFLCVGFVLWLRL